MVGPEQESFGNGRPRLPWSAEEVALVVADYFSMFEEHLTTGHTDKAAQRSALSTQVARSDKSIEFKHCNISAVLSELGLPWLPGYAPLHHYQRILIEEVEAQFDRISVLSNSTTAPARVAPNTSLDKIFANRPELTMGAAGGRPLERLVRKFNPAVRDERNRALGLAGEEFVIEVEKRRLYEAGRRNLKDDVVWISRDEGDGAGYDIRSIDPKTGTELFIEVKTTRGAKTTPFFLTRNEEAVSRERPKEWRLYRVFEFAAAPRIFVLPPPLDGAVNLTPAIWSASFR